MKTIKLNLFNYNELSEDAKVKAFENWQSERYEESYFWSEDSLNSLKEGLSHFGVELKNWSIDFLEPARNDYSLGLPYDSEDWSGDNAGEYLEALIYGMGEFNKDTLRGLGDCKFTGVCFDEAFADGVRIAYFKDGERDLKELIREGINSWESSVQKDAEYQYSEDYFKEEAIDNDMYFTEEGEVYEP